MVTQHKSLIYENKLSSPDDVSGFRLEGQAGITFPNGRMRMENALDPELGQQSNFVFWCPERFSDNIQVEWDFWPVREPGLCMLFLAAEGKNGEDLFDSALKERTGEYHHYSYGDIRTLHLSYFRRRYEDERGFHTCNLRKSFGFHLVAQGADPIPNVEDGLPPYHLTLIKQGALVRFRINELPILEWRDDGQSYGSVLGGGRIGFRQMAPLIGEYANFKVFELNL